MLCGVGEIAVLVRVVEDVVVEELHARGSPAMRHHTWGTWCSGITSASHAEGPGFKSQCVHVLNRTHLAAAALGRTPCRTEQTTRTL